MRSRPVTCLGSILSSEPSSEVKLNTHVSSEGMCAARRVAKAPPGRTEHDQFIVELPPRPQVEEQIVFSEVGQGCPVGLPQQLETFRDRVPEGEPVYPPVAPV